MKIQSKIKFKSLILFVLVVLLFYAIEIGIVFSMSSTLKLEGISILSKSDTVDEGVTDITGNVIAKNFTRFHKVGDYITYSAKIKNNTHNNYILKSISNNSLNEYISYTYDKYENIKLNSGETLEFIFTETYSQEVDDISKREQQVSVDFYLTLENNKGNIFTEKLKLTNNPIIDDAIASYAIISLVSLIPLVLIILIIKKLCDKKTNKVKKNKNINLKFFVLFIVFFCTLLPQVSKSLGDPSFSMALNNNIELKDKLLVSYDIDGIVDTVIVPYGAKLPIDTPYKEDYTFKGWQTGEGTLFDEESPIEDDLNLKAIFESNVYTITYHLNGGIAENPDKYTIEDEVIINDPSRAGYTFNGWTGTDLNELTKNLIINKGSTGDRVYTAHWTPNEYTIIFDSNGGSGNMDPKVMTYDISENLPSNKFKKNNETFLSWNTQQNGSGVSYIDGASVKNLLQGGSITLYAQWSNDWSMFTQGTKLNAKMKQLAGNSSAGSGTVNNNIIAIKRSFDLPAQDTAIVSTSESPNSIYMWYTDNVIYYYSDAKYIYLNPDSKQTFSYFASLKSIDTSDFLTDKVTNMSGMFGQCNSLQSLDLGSFNTFKVKNMSSMFNQCNALAALNVSSFNTSSVTDMNRMFTACTSLEKLNLSSFRTGNVEDMTKMFDNLPLIKSLDVSKFDTSKVKQMKGIFRNCPNIKTLDLRNFNTSAVINMEEMFSGCSQLTSVLITPSKFQTSNVKSMEQMFYQCNSLTSFNFSGFNTENLTDMSSMFAHCTSIKSLDLSSFNTSNVVDMSNLFNQCNSLVSLNISKFNTSLVTNMNRMFSSCYLIIKLDVSHFNTGNVVDMEKMFDNMFALTTIYASNKFTTGNVIKGANMFINDTNLVGGNRTVYDPSHVGYTYARIDSDSLPGYFTARP